MTASLQSDQADATGRRPVENRTRGRVVAGVALITIGVITTLANFLESPSFGALLVPALGIIFLLWGVLRPGGGIPDPRRNSQRYRFGDLPPGRPAESSPGGGRGGCVSAFFCRGLGPHYRAVRRNQPTGALVGAYSGRRAGPDRRSPAGRGGGVGGSGLDWPPVAARIDRSGTLYRFPAAVNRSSVGPALESDIAGPWRTSPSRVAPQAQPENS